MKRKRLDFARHKEIGLYLYRLNDEIGELLCEVSNAEGRNARITQNLEKIYQTIFKIRSQMENILFRDYPNQADIFIYYPGSSRNEMTVFEDFINSLHFD